MECVGVAAKCEIADVEVLWPTLHAQLQITFGEQKPNMVSMPIMSYDIPSEVMTRGAWRWLSPLIAPEFAQWMSRTHQNKGEIIIAHIHCVPRSDKKFISLGSDHLPIIFLLFNKLWTPHLSLPSEIAASVNCLNRPQFLPHGGDGVLVPTTYYPLGS